MMLFVRRVFDALSAAELPAVAPRFGFSPETETPCREQYESCARDSAARHFRMASLVVIVMPFALLSVPIPSAFAQRAVGECDSALIVSQERDQSSHEYSSLEASAVSQNDWNLASEKKAGNASLFGITLGASFQHYHEQATSLSSQYRYEVNEIDKRDIIRSFLSKTASDAYSTCLAQHFDSLSVRVEKAYDGKYVTVSIEYLTSSDDPTDRKFVASISGGVLTAPSKNWFESTHKGPIRRQENQIVIEHTPHEEVLIEIQNTTHPKTITQINLRIPLLPRIFVGDWGPSIYTEESTKNVYIAPHAPDHLEILCVEAPFPPFELVPHSGVFEIHDNPGANIDPRSTIDPPVETDGKICRRIYIHGLNTKNPSSVDVTWKAAQHQRVETEVYQDPLWLPL